MGLYGSYASQLRALLPRGRLWEQPAESRFTRLIAGLAEELERCEGRAHDMLDEADPRSADELLAEWAALLGCAATTEAVAAAFISRARQDDAFYQNIALLCGWTSGLLFERAASTDTIMSCNSACNASLYTWPARSMTYVTPLIPEEGDTEALLAALDAAKQLHWRWLWEPYGRLVENADFASWDAGAPDSWTVIAAGSGAANEVSKGVQLTCGSGGSNSVRVRQVLTLDTTKTYRLVVRVPEVAAGPLKVVDQWGGSFSFTAPAGTTALEFSPELATFWLDLWVDGTYGARDATVAFLTLFEVPA